MDSTLNLTMMWLEAVMKQTTLHEMKEVRRAGVVAKGGPGVGLGLGSRLKAGLAWG